MLTDKQLAAAIAGPKPRAMFDNSSAKDLEWGFLEDDEILGACRGAARHWAAICDDPMLDVDDLYQEALCFISCRPELQEQTPSFIWARVSARLRCVTNAAKRWVSLGLAGEPEDVYPEGDR